MAFAKPDPNPILHLSAEMMLELAMGLEPPITVVQKYGFTLADLIKLQNQPWFCESLMRDRERLRDEGYTTQAKRRLMNDELIQDLYIEAKGPGMKPELKLEISKHLSDLTGDRRPVAAPQATGPIFQINITVPENARGPVNVKELIATQKAGPVVKPMVLDMAQAVDPLPAGPPVHVQRFVVTSDLVGPPLPVGP